MGKITALVLALFSFLIDQSLAQESIQDWSNKVVELQDQQGQNFDQDITLVKGYLFLHRRQDALSLLSKLSHSAPKKNENLLNELSEAAMDQFFFQDTAESHADVLQLIRSDRWLDAREKLESALQKEPGHRQLVFRLVQVALASNSLNVAKEQIKFGEEHYSSQFNWKILYSWFSLLKEDYREVYRVLNPIWIPEKKKFEKEEAAYLVYLKMQEMLKFSPDWNAISKVIQKNPSWLGVRLWRLKNKMFTSLEKTKEIKQIQSQLVLKINAKRTKSLPFFYGLISLESIKKELDSLQLKINEKG